MHNYKKLNVWSESVTLAKEIYSLKRKFPKEERFGLISQMQRAAVSIASNIAEGAGRNSDKEFKYVLSVSAGSGDELETQLIIAKEIGYLNNDKCSAALADLDKIMKKIYVLSKRL